MKVALLADTHYGVRNDAPAFMDMTKRFVDDVVIPTMKREKVRQVVHLGDLLDRRKYVAFSTANRLWNDFVLPIFREVERFDVILGNHDVIHKNTNFPNGVSELFRSFESEMFRIHSGPMDGWLLDHTPALFLPWINDENREVSMDAIRTTRAQLCFGHLELEGFEMYRGHVAPEGMSRSLFSKFDETYSGHFHHKSSADGIHYLGSHGEFTWQDYDDARGFHVLDTKTRELEFFPNPYTMFEKLHYQEDVAFDRDADLTGKYVKVIVRERRDQDKFEQFISSVEQCNPIDLQVVDDHLNAGDALDDMEEIDEGEDTLSILRKALRASDHFPDYADKLDAFVGDLYAQAMTQE